MIAARLAKSHQQADPVTLNSQVNATNLVSFGIDAFTPVMNLPETAILGLGGIRKQPIVTTDDRIEAPSIMTHSLTFDHRAIDGAPAAKFLQSVVAAIENPAMRLSMAE